PVRDGLRPEGEDVGRMLRSRRESLPRNRVDQRYEIERIAAGAALERRRELSVRVIAQTLARERRSGLSAQAARANDDTGGIREKLADEFRAVGLFRQPCPDQKHERQPLQTVG